VTSAPSASLREDNHAAWPGEAHFCHFRYFSGTYNTHHWEMKNLQDLRNLHGINNILCVRKMILSKV
jgi:hypothetical protein